MENFDSCDLDLCDRHVRLAHPLLAIGKPTRQLQSIRSTTGSFEFLPVDNDRRPPRTSQPRGSGCKTIRAFKMRKPSADTLSGDSYSGGNGSRNALVDRRPPMADTRRYKFDWSLLGDVEVGRPNLGPLTSVKNYRLMQFSIRDILEDRLGTEFADTVFYDAGKLAGQAFAEEMIGPVSSVSEFVQRLTAVLAEQTIGVLRVEQAEADASHFVLTVSEDLDCSGLPITGFDVCVFDEGFISALLEWGTGAPFDVKEIDCWCTGDRTCRFEARAVA